MPDPSILRPALPPPFHARHIEYSLVTSMDDDPAPPTERLIAIGLDAAEHARRISLSSISARLPFPPYYPDIWPGEHYRLLAGLVLTLNPTTVVEIGTGSGLSALALKHHLRAEGRVVTFDTTPWTRFPESALRSEDFVDGRLIQIQDDLSNPLLFPLHLELLKEAELIFIDAAKDVATEQRLLDSLSTVKFSRNPIVVFDDIKLWNMLRIWREIRRPKLDLTSFGHWSGTGLIDWLG